MLESEADFYQVRELIDAVTAAKVQERKPKYDDAQECDLIEIVFKKNYLSTSVEYIGSYDTLEKIPLLMEFYVERSIGRDKSSVFSTLKETGSIQYSDFEHFRGSNNVVDFARDLQLRLRPVLLKLESPESIPVLTALFSLFLISTMSTIIV